MRVLGIEGTAWAASAAVFERERDERSNAGRLASRPDAASETESDDLFIVSDPYQPDSGGIHPREAAEHMAEAVPRVVSEAMEHAAAARDGDGPPVDAVAFSRGPGLGPCLRIVATAARALALSLDVPLVGVNHMVAHLEIGRYRSGFESPVCLNASGANAHLLGYHNGRYRVLGETMDTGVGNAIDKFTRHVGWTHPGGPKVEEAATGGGYIDLPYVVKGMDFSFSGIMSAAKEAYDEGEAIEDVCFSLQEHVFGMLTEVSERALSLTGTDELVLGGGVGQNARLREMLAEMCEERGAAFYAPEPRLLRDNAGMIAVLGARMFEAGDAIAVEDSAVDPNFRPDQVPVTWRGDAESVARTGPNDGALRGAEATVEFAGDRVLKRRLPKSYRHPELDARLRRERTVAEARLTSEARRAGVPTPLVRDVDLREATIAFQRVGDADLAEALTDDRAAAVGRHLAALHRAGIVHGDPTTRNARVGEARTFLIDFGLGYHTGHVEDHAMDLHVFEQSVEGTADDPDPLVEAFEDAYADADPAAVLDRLREIEGRGRYQ
ncbi:bifunctional N(6)-L-threonylcarbamoyladenine synthase/serine/threonine protein kinase [Halegenticoccus soli]|uniref:bifunctional N(6)-L-threonylcarbamoyladenine synthase/serine/threonine protein kinase n=1 Tax=Halegenticoccus soli TaxID=1985678 RepID=UPI000C6CBC0D|nr:bifunctional N(6)-L-threonylcarbamoyladenine synthase/serine/threonine protein kinase [Halegenticoccus soli]